MQTYSNNDGNEEHTTVKPVIAGGWPMLKPKKLDGVLACHLGKGTGEATFYGDKSAVSHRQLQTAITESFVEHVGSARKSAELVVLGAEILKIGPGGSQTEEIRAGEYVEARTRSLS